MSNYRLWIVNCGQSSKVKIYNPELLSVNGFEDLPTIYEDHHLSSDLVKSTINSVRFIPQGLIYIRFFKHCFITTSLLLNDAKVEKITHLVTENLTHATTSLYEHYSNYISSQL